MTGWNGALAGRFKIPAPPPVLRPLLPAIRLLFALLLSLWCPGLGQIYGRASWRGVFTFLYVTLSVAYLVLLTLLVPPVGRLVVAFHMVMLALTGLVWAIALGDSLILAVRRPGREPTRYDRWWVIPVFLLFMPLYLLGLGQAVKTYGPSSWERIAIITDSMDPTLVRGDTAVSWKTYYADHDPLPGDIIEIRMGGGDGRDIVALRRIAGLPGDRIQTIDGTLTVNDVPVGREVQKQKKAGARSPILETLPNGRAYQIREDGRPVAGGTTPAFIVPAGSVFVLKDNRYAAADEERKVPALIPLKSLNARVTAIGLSKNPLRLFIDLN